MFGQILFFFLQKVAHFFQKKFLMSIERSEQKLASALTTAEWGMHMQPMILLPPANKFASALAKGALAKIFANEPFESFNRLNDSNGSLAKTWQNFKMLSLEKVHLGDSRCGKMLYFFQRRIKTEKPKLFRGGIFKKMLKTAIWNYEWLLPKMPRFWSFLWNFKRAEIASEKKFLMFIDRS